MFLIIGQPINILNTVIKRAVRIHPDKLLLLYITCFFVCCFLNNFH